MKTFLTTIQLFQTTIEGNRLNNMNNFGMQFNSERRILIDTIIYSNYTCGILLQLLLFIGCYQVTSLLISRLECFYNILCLLEINNYLNSTISFNFSTLNSNLNFPNETINILVNKLMIDEWLLNFFTSSIKTIQINKPTLSIYEQLNDKSFDSFTCTCSQISIKYRLILNMTPRSHDICTIGHILYKNNNISNDQVYHTIPLSYNECHCGLLSKCVSSSRGMLIGYYPIETILKTSIQYLYNQTCIDSSNTFRAIKRTSLLSNRFSLNSTIESIINELMIEELKFKILYKNYILCFKQKIHLITTG
ncbi:hypothetical protein I4U23_031529 [Adineta vaga]|nr:hypothetical protein I4U23_031529 [Adineta vaga]